MKLLVLRVLFRGEKTQSFSDEYAQSMDWNSLKGEMWALQDWEQKKRKIVGLGQEINIYH